MTLTIRQIQVATAVVCDVPLETLIAPGKTRRAIAARNVAYHVCRNEINASHNRIGRAFGGRAGECVLRSMQHAVDPETVRQVTDAARLYEGSQS